MKFKRVQNQRFLHRRDEFKRHDHIAKGNAEPGRLQHSHEGGDEVRHDHEGYGPKE